MMLPHHQAAIAMAELDLEPAMVRVQSEEIVQMQQWYAAWFGKPRPSTPQNFATKRYCCFKFSC